MKEIPKHIAVIMDGNGRWARARGLPRLEGHRAGAAAVRRAVDSCLEHGVQYLTLFGFSTENWNRSDYEVKGLMKLFEEGLKNHLEDLISRRVRLRVVGDIARLPLAVRKSLSRDIDKTKDCDALTLTLAVSYGGREEIVAAAREIAKKVKLGELKVEDVDNSVFESSLWTEGLPDPDLLIRTSGEQRISNFLLWQLAYSEIVVCDEYWPDFDDQVLLRCLDEFNSRERRFGLTSEQINSDDLNKDNGNAGQLDNNSVNASAPNYE